MAKVLLVDDSMFTRSMLRKIIKGIGLEVIEASNGREGLDRIINEKPDLVVTDLLMPEMDGIELLSTVKDKSIKVPVVVMSANVQDTVRQQCLGLGAVEFFNKPPNEEKFQKYLEDFLEKGETA